MSGVLDGVHVVDGNLDASGRRFGIVVSRFNAFITERLLEGAVDTLCRLGARKGDITVVRVPGAWEIPQTVARLLRTSPPDAVIALGCLMRGDTIHFELIASEVGKGLASLGNGDVPVIFGVLTTDTLEQSVQRAGAKYGNKGAEAAQSAVEQANVFAALGSGSSEVAQAQGRAGRAQAARRGGGKKRR
jgi:6,7-dimethyl-8-ribityllumazine synthase